jgi:hypothetical protein
MRLGNYSRDAEHSNKIGPELWGRAYSGRLSQGLSKAVASHTQRYKSNRRNEKKSRARLIWDRDKDREGDAKAELIKNDV